MKDDDSSSSAMDNGLHGMQVISLSQHKMLTELSGRSGKKSKTSTKQTFPHWKWGYVARELALTKDSIQMAQNNSHTLHSARCYERIYWISADRCGFLRKNALDKAKVKRNYCEITLLAETTISHINTAFEMARNSHEYWILNELRFNIDLTLHTILLTFEIFDNKLSNIARFWWIICWQFGYRPVTTANSRKIRTLLSILTHFHIESHWFLPQFFH